MFRFHRTLTYRVLEQKCIFDSAAAATMADASASSDADAPTNVDADAAATPDLLAAVSNNLQEAESQPKSMVFIDAAVSNTDLVVDAVPPGAEVIFLDTTRDGVLQIADALEGRTGLDAIHIVSHGVAGSISLGNTYLSSHTIDGKHADALTTIGAALSDSGDILLYGCDVGAGTEGEAFLQALADKTGADIAASSDDTGHAEYGADWTLEASYGEVTENWTLSADFIAQWQHVLATASFQEGNNYFSTQDTMIDRLNPSTAYGSATTLFINDGSPNDRNILIRFDSIFGTGAGQIPIGATITSAELRFFVSNTDPGDSVQIYRMLTTWSEASTWNSLTSGVSTNGIEAASTPTASLDAGLSGTQVANVTADLQAWASGQTNFGWLIATGSSSADNWGFSSSENATVGARPLLVVTYTDPPVIDLDANNSSGATGSNFTRVFNEGLGPVTIADADATITDADSTNLTGMTVTLTSRPNGASEVLAANTSGTSITASYNSSTGVMTLSGTASVAQYQQVLRTITYNNTAADPTGGTRTITFTATDGTATSAVATTTLTVNLTPDDLQARPGISATSILGDYNFTSTAGSSRDDDPTSNPITWTGSPSVTTGQSGQLGAIDLTGAQVDPMATSSG